MKIANRNIESWEEAWKEERWLETIRLTVLCGLICGVKDLGSHRVMSGESVDKYPASNVLSFGENGGRISSNCKKVLWNQGKWQ
jgi:hypothetical protein